MSPRTYLAALLAGLMSFVGQAQADDHTTTLEVGYMPILPVAQLFVMEGEGWTEEAGLTLELTRFSSGPAMVQALASGELDVMYFGIGPAMVARANGVPIKVLASSIQEQIGLVARGEFADTFEDDDAAEAIARFTEEQGRKPKIATFPQGSVPDTVLRFWLVEQLGIGLDAVEIVAMGADRVQQALLAGAVDAASILEPILTTVQERDDSARVVARADSMLPGQPGAVLAAREATLEEHPEAMRALMALHLRATEMLIDEPERAAPHVREFVGRRLIDLATVETALSSPSSNYESDPHAIQAGTRRMHDFQVSQGSLRKEVDLDALFDTRLYDEVSEERAEQ
ncbi:ABC transporter substrate-binding protein [Halomonas urumqiensis]|uniref:Nitrate ABC transporter substrate-binding protein n=1 Tax=Halomonas urumqiensis TaxID=1684789 RepID=A0A2N7UKF1_9GAMM|nr:ABC transporter substrate-binding protein [Halomonas urumqiensis]PMR80889.1 nitrate ABC transporter substrate-binding protein [Halomonas urumqiensis]PTB02846.1 nitrate ABC transporter substrate-binding protein [Halomonas urumqiensis]GHE21363.1 sulfonate ABC transporter substrate-binding protein [Halomonas urumqiensis]